MKRQSSGRKNVPLRVCIYGAPGIGKSSWSASAPGAVVLDLENGTAHLDVDRIEVDDFNDVLDVIRSFKTGTLVIDSLSKLEELVTDHVLGQDRKPGVTLVNFGPGFGHGVNLAVQYFREFISAVDKCPANVILVAHSAVKNYSDPTGISYDRHQLAMNDKLANVVLKNMDFVLFAEHEVATRKADKKNVGILGDRVLRTDANAAWLAKHRGSLPESLPLDWTAFQDAVEVDRGSNAEKVAELAAMVASLDVDDATRGTMRDTIEAAASDTKKLAAIERRIQSKLNEKKEA